MFSSYVVLFGWNIRNEIKDIFHRISIAVGGSCSQIVLCFHCGYLFNHGRGYELIDGDVVFVSEFFYSFVNRIRNTYAKCTQFISSFNIFMKSAGVIALMPSSVAFAKSFILYVTMYRQLVASASSNK